MDEHRFNIHPHYGFADETRLRILKDADEMGTYVAARLHGVSPTVIYNWRRALRPTAGGNDERAEP